MNLSKQKGEKRWGLTTTKNTTPSAVSSTKENLSKKAKKSKKKN